jgi:hypothetical protein
VRDCVESAHTKESLSFKLQADKRSMPGEWTVVLIDAANHEVVVPMKLKVREPRLIRPGSAAAERIPFMSVCPTRSSSRGRAQSAVTLAIVAGGAGRAWGCPKAEIRIEGRPILEHLLDAIRWPGPTMLVTAPGREHPPANERFDREVVDAVAGGRAVRAC